MVWGSYGGRKYKRNLYARAIYVGGMKNAGEWLVNVENMASRHKMSFSKFVVSCINYAMEKLENDYEEERRRLEAKAIADRMIDNH